MRRIRLLLFPVLLPLTDLAKTGGAYHMREAEKRNDQGWFESYLVACESVRPEVDRRRTKVGNP